MPFDKLCSLDSEILQRISLEIKKTKMNVNENMFTTTETIKDPN